MHRLVFLVALIALALSAIALVMLRNQDEPEPYQPFPTSVTDEKPTTPTEALQGPGVRRPQRGGVYAGRVLTVAGDPIEKAVVLLVRVSTGADLLGEDALAGNDEDGPTFRNPYGIAMVGELSIAGETRTEGDGHFSIAANARDHISHVVAYQDGYFFKVDDLRTTENDEQGGKQDIELRLQEAGRVKGLVVDDESGTPIPNALVEVYMQQIAPGRVADPEGETSGGKRVYTKETRQPLSPIVELGAFIAKHLGERIWGIAFEGQGSEALRVRTNRAGRFEIGPLGSEVQVEFIVTHADFAWTDMDRPRKDRRPLKRSIVMPGETLERTFRLVKGGEIEGVILDQDGVGMTGVVIGAESIEAHVRHWLYNQNKQRVTTSGKDGAFRIAGLAPGRQNLIARHPAIGVTTKYAVEAGTKGVVITANRLGGLKGRITGERLPAGTPVMLSIVAKNDDGGMRGRWRKRAVLRADMTFEIGEFKPGKYEGWVLAGASSSLPTPFVVEPLKLGDVTFKVGGGGELALEVVDDRGTPIEGVKGRLIAVRLDSTSPAKAPLPTAPGDQLGMLVSREGTIAARGLIPRRYRLRISAMGFATRMTDAFDVVEGERTELAPLVLKRWATLSFHGFKTAADEHVRGAIKLEVKDSNEPFRVIRGLRDKLQVQPGAIQIRASVFGSDVVAATKVSVGEGEHKPIQIVFKSPKK